MGKRKKTRVSKNKMEDEEDQYQDDLTQSSPPSNHKSLYEVYLNLLPLVILHIFLLPLFALICIIFLHFALIGKWVCKADFLCFAAGSYTFPIRYWLYFKLWVSSWYQINSRPIKHHSTISIADSYLFLFGLYDTNIFSIWEMEWQSNSIVNSRFPGLN